jgi:hypothetical protein
MSYFTGLFTLELFSTLAYVCFGLSNDIIDTQIECPSPSCTCNGISATCSDNQLSYIPRFPGKIRQVYMLNTNLGNISDEGLSNKHYKYKMDSDIQSVCQCYHWKDQNRYTPKY